MKGRDRLRRIIEDAEYITECMTALEEILRLPNCNDCAICGTCEYRPMWGRPMRYNCPLFERRDDNA